ncbi:hypothetical protein VT84_06410 [Gemmata sp. SH-PL17]|uniref:hypothetical protein n=1 Tax=Gemmata sp. SH-PL17 TaxID=1630693 RepID=UPI00078C9F05|nr:hypothetical protein [Gemmata sp. SH-PL17]AMV24009.1 hypothetical protein VT84_06410 [Gemmata sp. SH-PL17]
MSERRPLIEGLKSNPANDPVVEKQFVFGGRTEPVPPVERAVAAPVRAPLTTRIRADYVAALKRASLTRQLDGQIPSSLQEILEEALEPWLTAHGYVP